MKKLLYFIFAFTFIGCSNSDEYSSFSEELENSVYIEAGTHEINGVMEKWENYHTFNFSSYGFKQNGFTVEGNFRATCYSTFYAYQNGQITSDNENSLTYVQGGNTLTITKINDETIKFKSQSSNSSSWEYNLKKSDFQTLEALKVGKRSSNTCD